MDFKLILIEKEDMLNMVHKAKELAKRYGMKLKDYIQKQKYGKHLHHILKKEIFIFISIV